VSLNVLVVDETSLGCGTKWYVKVKFEKIVELKFENFNEHNYELQKYIRSGRSLAISSALRKFEVSIISDDVKLG
jgi:hypothetical protein